MNRSRILAIMLVITVILSSACSSPQPAATPTTAPPAAGSPAATTAPPAADQPVRGGTIVVSHGQNVSDTLNQHTSTHTTSRMVAHHVLDTLTAVNPNDGSIHPSLATSWEVSPDGKVYTFKLRTDVKFHDGTPFNAESVKFNFDYTMRDDIRHGFAWSALGGTSFDRTEVVDSSTVKVYLKAPNAAFLVSLSDGGLGIDSPTAMQAGGEDYGIKTLVGSGPFKFKEWVKGDHITLVRSDEYNWAPDIFQHSGPAYLDEIIYRDIQDVATRIAALEAGELTLATSTEPMVAQLRGNPDIQILLTPKAGTARMYTMNLGKSPTDDIRVRQAIAHAIDKAALLGLPAWSGIGRVAVAPIPRNMVPNGDLSAVAQYDIAFDPAKAKSLLDEAGWKVGSDGIREKGGQKMVVDWAITAASVPQVEPVEQMLRDVGIGMNIRTGDFNFWISECEKLNYNMTLMSDSGYNTLFLLDEFWQSESAGNWQAYSNPKFDEYLAKALAGTTQQEIWNNAMLAMAETMKDVQGVNAWEQDYVYGASTALRGVAYHEIGWPFFYDAWLSK